MECRLALVYAELTTPGLDLDEVRLGQLLTTLSALITLVMIYLLGIAT
jgi:hypothetical protein